MTRGAKFRHYDATNRRETLQSTDLKDLKKTILA
jgi:hypothetical protein